MKFLLDQSADFRLIDHLRRLGHDVTAVSRNYPHSLADEDVLAIADVPWRHHLPGASVGKITISHRGGG